MANLNEMNVRINNLESNKYDKANSVDITSGQVSATNIKANNYLYTRDFYGTGTDDLSARFWYNGNKNTSYLQRTLYLDMVAGLKVEGIVEGTKIYNAVWNDYAEFYERGEPTEAGDIIMLDINSEKEQYIKATEHSTLVVGIHSDEFGHLIGGEPSSNGQDYITSNIKKYIPVGLVGRVKTKMIGVIHKGDYIVVSDIPGVGRKYNPETDNVLEIIGIAVEDKLTESIQRVRMHLGRR